MYMYIYIYIYIYIYVHIVLLDLRGGIYKHTMPLVLALCW